MRSPLVAALALALLAAPGLAEGADDLLPMVVAGPGAYRATYATPAVAAEVGGSLTFLNADVFNHDVVADQVFGPDGMPWCDGVPPGTCPLFWSALIGVGETTPVLGLGNLEAGKAYPFYCTIHTGMKGLLVALPAVG